VNRCTFPVGLADDGNATPCDRRAVALYIVNRSDHPRCKRHDTKGVRLEALRRGYERRELVTA
jgi:hypothetical protein